MGRKWIVLAFGMVAMTAPAYGHHSFVAFYDENASVSVQGYVVVFDYRNPHAWVHFEARDNDGRLQRISAEWANPGRLLQQGILKDTIKPGDPVIVTGSPSRDPTELKMHLKGITRLSDGWKWAMGGERR
jgi:hypothetical protein